MINIKKFLDSLKARLSSNRAERKEMDDDLTIGDRVLTFKLLKNKIEERIGQKNAKKVAVIELKKFLEICDDTDIKSRFNSLADEGYTLIIASVNSSGEVEDVEIIRNKSETIDKDIDEFINRTGEGMVVVEA